MKRLIRARWLWEVAAVAVLVFAAGLAFWLGRSKALDSLNIQRITPDQAAMAMANDEFYSDYNEATLLIHGSVASVTMNNGGTSTVGFATTGTAAQCQMNQSAPTTKVGYTITVVTEGAQARRLPNGGVLLTNCVPIAP